MAKRPQMTVELPADISESLGLGEGPTSVRPLAAGSRALLLERIGVEGSAIPWDRELVLSADVRAFSLADVLQMLHATGKSGFLLVEAGDCAKCVYLHSGEVVFASSNQLVDRLGETLVRTGALDAEEHRKASAAYSPTLQFGRFLVERGLLSPRKLWEAVKGQVEDIVRSLFAFGSGQLYFWEGEVRPDNVVRLSLPTGRLIEDGLGLRDELLAFLAQLEDRRVRLEVVPDSGVDLDGSATAIVQALGRTETFSALCHEVGLDSLSAARTVKLLDQLGVLRLVRVGRDAFDADPRDAGEALRDCVRNHAKLLAELCAPIVAMEGAAPLQERLGEVAVSAAERHPHLLGGIEVAPGGVLDPEPLIERALCFPGDREREVRIALGELVAYVEFELLNHPRIPNAEDFLDALGPLRSEL